MTVAERFSEADRQRYADFLHSSRPLDLLQVDIPGEGVCCVLTLSGATPENRIFLHLLSEGALGSSAGVGQPPSEDWKRGVEENIRQIQRFVSVIAKAAKSGSTPPEITENVDLVRDRILRLEDMVHRRESRKS
jgi:hypothetical protein